MCLNYNIITIGSYDIPKYDYVNAISIYIILEYNPSYGKCIYMIFYSNVLNTKNNLRTIIHYYLFAMHAAYAMMSRTYIFSFKLKRERT